MSRSLRLSLLARVFVAAGIGCFTAVGLSSAVIAQKSDIQTENKKAPVDLQADTLENDETAQTVTASGDVVLKQAGRTVQADKIVYNLKDDVVVASGNVKFTDTNGDVHTAQEAKFNNALKDGFVEGLLTMLVDGSRFTADEGEYKGGVQTVMKDTAYTPCTVCEVDPDFNPLWQIRAAEVKHDKETKQISYKHATFEVKGVPVAYLPYFSHPDGTVKQKSGFLAPSAGYTSELGAFVQGEYYWALAPNRDLTTGLIVTSQELPVATAQYRHRWENASLIADGSVTYSERNDRIAGERVVQDEELRGNLSVDGIWDINDKWRSGLNLDLASDDQYLRQYDFNSKDVLENELYVERFSGRNYASGRIIGFQDLRIEEEEEDQPIILPEIEASFIGEPDSVPLIGGRWSLDTSFLSLMRDDNEQDVNRAYASLGWHRRHVADMGLVSTFDAAVEGSFYDVNDRTGAMTDPDIEGNSTASQGFAYFNAQTSYPMAKKLEKAQVVVEPIASVTVAPNISIDDDIPNEDSLDVQIDVLNLFKPDRFPGEDRVEDQSHATYGVKTGVYGDEGSYGEVFLGQSYRFEEDDNPFTEGSGLDGQDSDVVGQVTASYKGDYTANYRFQLENENLSSQRHEIDAYADFGKLKLSSQYLYARSLEGTDIDETREQVRAGASYYVNDNWRVFGSSRHDLGQDPGLREAGLGVGYTGQCISVSLIGQRTLTNETSGDSGTEIFFRIGLKNLGEFSTSGLQITSDNDE
ncbi:MAG: LPS assembly protein LptD [Alphaproteobacteria bacterium]|nr:LPS assembly protein LptD [Alphaproteobacteria bacterium]